LSSYDNLSTGHRRFSEGYEFIEADIADEVRLAKALERTGAVMHFVPQPMSANRSSIRENIFAIMSNRRSSCSMRSWPAAYVSSSSRQAVRPTEFRRPFRLPSRALRRPSILMERPNCFSSTRSLPVLTRTDCAQFRCVTSMPPELTPGIHRRAA
jgi:hypothetical protein